MRDALGAVQSVLVLGGNSEIAISITERLVDRRCRTVVLAVRDPLSPITATTADTLRGRGATTVEAIAFDALASESHSDVIAQAFDRFGDFDLVISAFGVLGDQETFNNDPTAAAIAASTNFVGAVSSSLAVASRLRAQGHGVLMVITSVAGVRARADNFVYGSTKAGLDAFAQGLGDSLVDSGARVVVVRPGFVHTRMTEGMKPAPFAATSDKIADAVVAGFGKGREIIWAPPILAIVFGLLRHLPRSLWRKVSAR
ncbi:FabG Dehydrogenases with different specificities (related to short-chain alcohol dehydrogenases) [Acidimicrobiia bacterium]